MKNAFYFTLKALFIHNIFKFCPAFFGPVGQRLDTKARIKDAVAGFKTQQRCQ